MYKNIILIPAWMSFGDGQALVPMIYFLLNYYEKVHFYLKNNCFDVVKYFSDYFSKDELFNKRIFIITNPEEILSNSEYNEYHILDFTERKGYLFYDTNKCDKKYYFNKDNKLYNIHDIDEKYKNIEVEPKKIRLMHVSEYEVSGLNVNVRLDYYKYNRDYEKEELYNQAILSYFNISQGEKYNIINLPPSCGNFNNEEWKKYIKNDYKTINISNLADFPGYLLKFVENAESIHLVDSSNVQLLYLNQYKKNINIYNKDKIYFHVWKLNRNWMENEEEGIDYLYKSLQIPKLENWEFVF